MMMRELGVRMKRLCKSWMLGTFHRKSAFAHGIRVLTRVVAVVLMIIARRLSVKEWSFEWTSCWSLSTLSAVRS